MAVSYILNYLSTRAIELLPRLCDSHTALVNIFVYSSFCMGMSPSVGLVRIIPASNCGCICNLDGHHQGPYGGWKSPHSCNHQFIQTSLLREVFITNWLRHQPDLGGPEAQHAWLPLPCSPLFIVPSPLHLLAFYVIYLYTTFIAHSWISLWKWRAWRPRGLSLSVHWWCLPNI